MKLTSRKKNKKIIIATSVIVPALLLMSVAYIFFARPFDKKISSKAPNVPVGVINYDPPTDDEKAAAGQQKEDIIKDYEKDQTDNNQTPSGITVSISLADQASAGKDLNIRALVEGATSGECKITLTQQGQTTVTKSFPLVFEATSSRCQGADIAASEFNKGGEWNLSLVVVSGAAQSNIVQQSVTITK